MSAENGASLSAATPLSCPSAFMVASMFAAEPTSHAPTNWEKQSSRVNAVSLRARHIAWRHAPTGSGCVQTAAPRPPPPLTCCPRPTFPDRASRHPRARPSARPAAPSPASGAHARLRTHSHLRRRPREPVGHERRQGGLCTDRALARRSSHTAAQRRTGQVLPRHAPHKHSLLNQPIRKAVLQQLPHASSRHPHPQPARASPHTTVNWKADGGMPTFRASLKRFTLQHVGA